ncbi:ABC transporter ATP-binding protein [Streptomyces goshikiensis]
MTGQWRRVLALLWSISPRQILAVTAASLATALLPAAQVFLTALTVQSVADALTSPAAADRGALRAGACLAALLVAGHLLGVLHANQEALLRSRLPDVLTLRIMAKAGRLTLGQFEEPDTYDNLQRATREAAFRPLQVFTGMLTVVSAALSFLAVATVLLRESIAMAAAICLAPVPAALAGLWFSRRTHAAHHAQAEGRRTLTYLEHLLTNDRTYKETRLFNLVPLLLDRSRRLTDDFHATNRRIENGQARWTALLGLLSTGTTAAAVLLAVRSALHTGQVGALAGYVAGVAVIQAAVSALFTSGVQLYENGLFLRHLFGFLDMPEPAVREGTLALPPVLSKGIEFREVTFTYPGQREPVLDGVSFTVPAGARAALVGSNGAGKSTLIKLLTRFYEPTGGTILIDGRPLSDYSLQGLREGIGAIFQDYQEYEAPVRENIGFGKPALLDDDGRIREAAHRVGALAFLDTLPEGIYTRLGRWFPGGRQLSGGQWQKVALARALVGEAPVLILDEPTAAIDAAAEADILDVLRTVGTGATSLLVAHRFSAVRTADHIVVLDAGRVLEQGSHEQLMESGGRYASLFGLQAAGYR